MGSILGFFNKKVTLLLVTRELMVFWEIVCFYIIYKRANRHNQKALHPKMAIKYESFKNPFMD